MPEARLGELGSVQAFNEIKPLLEPMTQFAGSPSMFMPADAWEQWHNAASHQLAQIVGAIHKSLYALFADAPINERAAERAYGALFSELGLSPTAGVGVRHDQLRHVAATLFGYDEFILREISPETLRAAGSPGR